MVSSASGIKTEYPDMPSIQNYIITTKGPKMSISLHLRAKIYLTLPSPHLAMGEVLHPPCIADLSSGLSRLAKAPLLRFADCTMGR